MRTKTYKVLGVVLCLCPIVFFAMDVAYVPLLEYFRPGIMSDYFHMLLYVVFTLICLLFTLACLLLRFMLYVTERKLEDRAYTVKRAVIAFAKEPYHDVFERISDVTMTLQAALCLVAFVMYVQVGGPLW